MHEPDREGYDGPRGEATGSERSTHLMSASTIRPAHDTEQLNDAESSVRAPSRPAETVHTTVPEAARRHKSDDGTVSKRTVTRYDANSPEVILDRSVEQSQPNTLERDSMPVHVGYNTFAAHR